MHDTQDNDPVLCQLIASRIAAAPQQRITFAQYMDLVLYHPQHGYYARDKVNIGGPGDFFTSPHLGSDFGELLAEQFLEMWEILGHPHPFTIVEMGAGQGLIAADILRYLDRHHQDFFRALEYVVVEKTKAMRATQQRLLASQKSKADAPNSEVSSECQAHQAVKSQKQVRWCALEEIQDRSIVGCVFSNELVDALPVHQVVVVEGQLQEIYITVKELDRLESGQKEIKFVEAIGELSTPQLAQYFNLVGIAFPSDNYPVGYRTEVNLAALDWLTTAAAKLQRGYLLTIDYGYPASSYYRPARSEGTLQCYYQHRHHNNPYIYIGYQDLTAHVDFTALERQGELCGLQPLGFTQQGLFLMALGLGERLAALSQPGDAPLSLQQVLQGREALHQLINPMGLGGFRVLVQTKGLQETEEKRSLKGLRQF
ncbi:MAG: class I SAM-dependent methyltransferase [Cyanosarcina radialis HA8281-LM2]|jgi:SAM-dependent MidA family methyltransferase|nr:class I SAM-dependent methyltransferase [Cyanosarcina radialis HA8281-LM2]